MVIGNFFLRFNLFNYLLGKKIASGACGLQDDFYIFINETWYGREPNTSGKSTIRLMLGAFPALQEFPDSVMIPPSQILNLLPSKVRNAVSSHEQGMTVTDTIIARTFAYQKNGCSKFIFKLAQTEHRLADWLLIIVYK